MTILKLQPLITPGKRSYFTRINADVVNPDIDFPHYKLDLQHLWPPSDYRRQLFLITQPAGWEWNPGSAVLCILDSDKGKEAKDDW